MTWLSDLFRGSVEQQIFNAILLFGGAIGSVIFAVLGYREWRRGDKPILATLCIGAVVGSLGEAGARILIDLRLDPVSGTFPLYYRAFGIDVGMWFVVTTYPVLMCMFCVFFYRVFEQRRLAKDLWITAGTIFAVWSVIEIAYINVGRIYEYGGVQPLKVFGLAIVWPVAYVVACALFATLLYVLGRNLTGARYLLLLIPIVSATFFGGLAIVAWPSIMAVNSTLPQSAVDLIGVVTLAWMALVMYLITTFAQHQSRGDATRHQETAHSAHVLKEH